MAKGIEKHLQELPDEDLGFEGLLIKGYTPAQAHKIVIDKARRDNAGAIYADLRESESGRELIADTRKVWAKYNLESPVDIILREYDAQANRQPENQ